MEREPREELDGGGEVCGEPQDPVGPIHGGDVVGNIEIRSGNGVKWLLVREGEGLEKAAHRALDLYIGSRCRLRVRVLSVDMLQQQWRCFIDFKPAPPSSAPAC